MKTHLSRRLAFIEAPFALERVDKRKYPLKKVKNRLLYDKKCRATQALINEGLHLGKRRYKRTGSCNMHTFRRNSTNR